MLAHDKTYNKTRATSEDSDQPARPRSLIRVFDLRMCILQSPGYPKTDKREPLSYWVVVQTDLSLCWSHRYYCKFCRALDHMANGHGHSISYKMACASSKYLYQHTRRVIRLGCRPEDASIPLLPRVSSQDSDQNQKTASGQALHCLHWIGLYI